MPRRICIIHRAAIDIAEPVPCPGIERVWHDGVRLDEAAGLRVIEPGAIVVQADVGFQALAGEEAVGQGEGDGVGDDLAQRVENYLTDGDSCLVGDEGG